MHQSRNFRRTRPPRKKPRPPRSASPRQKRKQKSRSSANSKKELTTDKVRLMLYVPSVPSSKTNATTELKNVMQKRSASVSSRNLRLPVESNSKIRKTDLLPRPKLNAMNSWVWCRDRSSLKSRNVRNSLCRRMRWSLTPASSNSRFKRTVKLSSKNAATTSPMAPRQDRRLKASAKRFCASNNRN